MSTFNTQELNRSWSDSFAGSSFRSGEIKLAPLIDCHVHFREPGLEHKADMTSETEAAYFGGISVVCEMPNTIPPTQSINALRDKVRRADARVNRNKCNIFFFFGATELAHLAELKELWTNSMHAELKARCCGLKLYLDNSTGDLQASRSVVESAFELCGKHRIPLVAHCEQSYINASAAASHPFTSPASHSLRRPSSSEIASVHEAIKLAEQFNTPLHLAHVSTAGAINAVRDARKRDPTILLTCEVAPHHLFLSSEDYTCCGNNIKVNPPIRTQEDNEALWRGVLDGTVDCIATDHAPHTQLEKSDITNPPSGMPSVEVVVPLLLTVISGEWPHPHVPRPAILEEKPLRVSHLIRLMHHNPNSIFHLNQSSEPVTTFDLDKAWVVNGKELHSKCMWTPYEGWKLRGKAILEEEKWEEEQKQQQQHHH